MEHKQVPRIILRGDQEAASHMSREGMRQLDILKGLMGFQNLEQDVRRVRFIDGSEIICRSVFGIDDVQIYAPKEEWKWTVPIIPRFFAKVATGEYYDEFFGRHVTTYSYFWIYFGDAIDVVSRRVKKSYVQPSPSKYNNNIVILKISNNFERTKEEIEAGFGFHWTLDRALTPFVKLSEIDTPCFAVKSFMLEDDHTKDKDQNYVKERWIATNHYLMKDRNLKMNVRPKWTPPAPCDIGDMPCPPNRFYCDIDKKILVWYGSFEIFVGALVVRFDDLNEEEKIYTFTWNSVAASGTAISGDRGYETLADTEWDIPLNMISGVNWVNDTEISFYLPYGTNRRPGQVTIDWIDYEWGASVSTGVIDYAGHWYWTENGFEKKDLALLDQTILDDSMEDEYEFYSWPGSRDCHSYDYDECMANSEIKQYQGMYKRTVNLCNGYLSNYCIKIFDESFIADTINRNLNFEEQKFYNAGHCTWWGAGCHTCNVSIYSCVIREIPEQIHQKVVNGLSAFWNSNNIAYFYEEKNREKCWAYASQKGTQRRVCGDTLYWVYFGGSSQEDFKDDSWEPYSSEGCIPFSACPGGLGYSFELTMPGDDWFITEEDYVEYLGPSPQHGDHYRWIKKSDADTYEEPIVRKYKIDKEIEFDATKIYKTYYLDDRATEDTQGMIVAGKGIEEESKYWEVYHEWINEDNVTVRDNITKELFEKLNCEHGQLVEIGLI